LGSGAALVTAKVVKARTGVSINVAEMRLSFMTPPALRLARARPGEQGA
jgi:hypothetical protein